ncbi:MAG: hypothetical protein HQL28_07345, partial [Candidatus Omnitrophica bacterium]|nr:hypothetical protein [Candidatus Omnitrophota bacterium]
MSPLQMTTRLRTVLLISFSVIVLIGVIYISSRFAVMRGFEQLEQKYAEKNTTRARETVFEKLNSLSVKIVDWSNWDDSYAFMENRNEAFVKSNLKDDSLKNLRINFIVFIN